MTYLNRSAPDPVELAATITPAAVGDRDAKATTWVIAGRYGAEALAAITALRDALDAVDARLAPAAPWWQACRDSYHDDYDRRLCGECRALR